MFVAPAVAWEISEPPRMPRGTSCSAPGLTSFMRATLPRSSSPGSGDRKIVVQPLRPLGANAVVERLRAGAVEQLHALAPGVLDQRARQREQRLVGRRDLVEVAVGAHQREELDEVALAGDPDGRARRLRGHCVMPPNCPPVMFRTWPCT